MVKSKYILPTSALVLSLLFPSFSDAAISGKIRKSTPQHRKGGESFPPLPLPATPLRRTEKKRPPRPSRLIGEITLNPVQGEKKWEKYEDQRNLQAYMRSVNSVIGKRFSSGKTNFKNFSFNPIELPILYFSGTKPFELNDESRNSLRWYLNDGGSIIFDAAENSDEFRKSALKEMTLIFPNKEIKKLPLDHPVFYSTYKFSNVDYLDKDKKIINAPPELYGINLGCRTAIFLTPIDLDCNWDGQSKADYIRMQTSDSRKLAVNMATYMLAEYRYGRSWSIKNKFEKPEKLRDSIMIPRIIHSGEWDAQGGLQNLLRYAHSESTIPTNFEDVSIKLSSKELFKYPMVYMSGLSDFSLSEPEIENARKYFEHGGKMFADSTAGRANFDYSFRKFISQVFPNEQLTELDQNHPFYNCFNKISDIGYTPTFSNISGIERSTPKLEAIVGDDGDLKVIYSKLDVGTKWGPASPVYELGIEKQDALRLGLNFMIYGATH